MDFGSVTQSLVFFLLLTAFGFVLGGIVYALCAYPGARRPQWRSLGASKPWGVFLGGVIAVGISAMVYWSTWREFYRLEVKGDAVVLTYCMPARAVVVPLEELAQATWSVTSDRWANRCLVVATQDGRRYRSANFSRHLLEKKREELEALLPGATE